MGDPNQACHDATQKALREGDSEMLGYLASIIDSRKDAADAAVKYAAQLAEATARVGELEDALRWYGDEGNWNKACVDDGRAGYTWTRPIIADKGKRARDVLDKRKVTDDAE